MEIRQLRYFVAVAETGGFGRAARSLNIVQAAVSQDIQRLERELGVRLFDRSTRHVRLTAAGTRLLSEAETVLRAVERTRQVAADLSSGREGVIRLGIGRAFDRQVHNLLTSLANDLPGIGVDPVRATRADRLARVRNGELDAAVVRDVDPPPGLAATPLWTDQVLAVLPAGHPAAKGDVARAADLADLVLRLAPRHSNPPFHDLIVRTCEAAGLSPQRGEPFTTLQGMLHDIGGGEPAWTAFYPLDEPPQVDGVAVRPLAGVTVGAFLVTRPDGESPAVIRLLAQLRS
ncbi:LysR family transcriptional regulator [Flindersiella endophytica]